MKIKKLTKTQKIILITFFFAISPLLFFKSSLSTIGRFIFDCNEYDETGNKIIREVCGELDKNTEDLEMFVDFRENDEDFSNNQKLLISATDEIGEMKMFIPSRTAEELGNFAKFTQDKSVVCRNGKKVFGACNSETDCNTGEKCVENLCEKTDSDCSCFTSLPVLKWSEENGELVCNLLGD